MENRYLSLRWPFSGIPTFMSLMLLAANFISTKRALEGRKITKENRELGLQPNEADEE